MNGNVAKTVLNATGIGCESLIVEFSGLVEKNGFEQDTLTIDQLREVMADYLNKVFLELADAHGDLDDVG